MTAVMRAMPQVSGPRVLRVGVVQRGRVVEERVIKQRITVTVGSSEEATFLVPSPVVPPLHALFERDGDGYSLNVLEGMSGRIALASGILDLPAVPARIALPDDARGKVVIGHTTLLFQFVEPPPVQPRPQLPLAVKGGVAGSNDWSLTFIAAFSFLVHFGIVGAMYSDWSDPIVADRYDVAGLTDLLSRIPAPPVEVPEQPGSIATPTTPTKTEAPTKTETARAPSTPRERSAATPSQSPTPGQVDNEKSAKLAERAEAMRIENLVALEGGPAVSDALRRSNVPGVDLSSAAERNIGVAKGGNELDVGNGGAPVQASKRGGLSVLGGPTKTEGIGDRSGTQTATAGPTAIAQVGVTNATVAIPNADSVVAGLRGRFRSCYQKGLLDDSTMSGKVIISAKVGTNGEVVSSDVVSNAGLSPAVGRCIADVVRRATFSAPGGSASTLQIPVTFVQSK
jgi:outer membrane biosynthesis protein TonB